MATDAELRAEARQRIEAQLKILTDAHPRRLAAYAQDDKGAETQDLADFRFLHDPTGFLVRVDALADVVGVLESTFDVGTPPVPEDDPDLMALDMVRFPLPSRLDGKEARVLDALDIIDVAFGTPPVFDPQDPHDMSKVVATPDHWLHLCAIGSGRICPAVEPEVTDDVRPYPPEADDRSLGSGFRVSVVDTGWHPPAALDKDTTWVADVDGDPERYNGTDVRRYAGHGTFVAGVVKCFAPGAQVRVEGFLRRSGAIRESKMVKQLSQALDSHNPHIINLSAGTTTRNNHPLLSFSQFFAKRLKPLEGACVLVAAAGNEGVEDPFWPASFEWALGVGSLDRDGELSKFSNFGSSAEIFAVGRDIINAFPTGRYVTRETQPPQQRDFESGLARWSGTSFSAPMVAGLIAAELSNNGGDVAAAKQTIRDSAIQATLLPKHPGATAIAARVLEVP
jgi:hypothetical protein